MVAGILAFALGILLSAPFWLPSITELRYVNIAAIETGMFNARLNLVPLDELLSPRAFWTTQRSIRHSPTVSALRRSCWRCAAWL